MKYFIFFIIVLFCLSGCANYPDFLSKEDIVFMKDCVKTTDETYVQETDSGEIEASEKDVCYNLLAKKENKADYCALIKMKSFSGDCYFHFAVARKDPELCKLAGGTREYDCLILVNLKPLTEEDIQEPY